MFGSLKPPRRHASGGIVDNKNEPIDLGITGPTEFGTVVANAMSLCPGEWQFSQDCSTAYHDLYGVLAYRNGRLYHSPMERTSALFEGRTDVGRNQRYLTIEDVAPIMEAWKAALTRAIEKPDPLPTKATANTQNVPIAGTSIAQQMAQIAQLQQQQTKAVPSPAANPPAFMFDGHQFLQMRDAAKAVGLSDRDILNLLKF